MMNLYGKAFLIFLFTCFISPQQIIGWPGPNPVFYQRFDLAGLTQLHVSLMSGTGSDDGAIKVVSTNRGRAVRLDHTLRQWIDLGVQTEPCLTLPDTSGAEGGSLSLWARVSCSTYSGILSSQRKENGRGIHVGCTPSGISTTINVKGGYYAKFDDDIPLREWSHIVVNYEVSAFNPTTLTEFRTYVNGELVLNDRRRYEQETSPGDRRLVIGRAYSAVDNYYTSMDVDHVVFFNEPLSFINIKWLLRNNL